ARWWPTSGPGCRARRRRAGAGTAWSRWRVPSRAECGEPFAAESGGKGVATARIDHQERARTRIGAVVVHGELLGQAEPHRGALVELQAVEVVNGGQGLFVEAGLRRLHQCLNGACAVFD